MCAQNYVYIYLLRAFLHVFYYIYSYISLSSSILSLYCAHFYIVFIDFACDSKILKCLCIISGMNKFDVVKFSKSRANLAGDVLIEKNESINKVEALTVLSNWRAAHSYPMHIFKQRLKLVSEKIDKNALSAQRLKRVPSIVKKLGRSYGGERATMKLTQMQDIAGCRVVLSSVSAVREIHEKSYGKRDTKHKKVNEKDYITYPKEDGYRSIHLVYRYNSDKKADYNGLLVEIQLRSKLQHLWATAVETVDFFTMQAIKSNEGRKDWVSFFRLVSSAFALLEKCPVVPGTSDNMKELCHLIKEKEKMLQVRSKMKHWATSIRVFDQIKKKFDDELFLLELDSVQEKLTISSYSRRNEEKALRDYAAVEKRIFGNKKYDVVLVGSDSVVDLKKAYPNYFSDTGEFLKNLDRILKFC